MARLSRENKASRAAPRVRRPAKAVAVRPTDQRRKSPADTPYHHGDLHEALLQSAERVLERDGLAGLTLRAVAREAGVSHAAPTHHFGDLSGLLSELAAIGFRMFNAAMVDAGNSETLPLMKALARAKAYVAYAQARPGIVRRVGQRGRRRPPAEPVRRGARGAVARAGRRNRARLVAGARFHDVAARRASEGHSAPSARGHRCRSVARRDVALDRRPPAGALTGSLPGLRSSSGSALLHSACNVSMSRSLVTILVTIPGDFEKGKRFEAW